MKNKIKVCHLITGLGTGGAEQMLFKLLSRSDHERFKCTVISLTDAGRLGKRIEELGIPIFTLGMKNARSLPGSCLRLYTLLRSLKPDILQTWLYHADLFGLLIGRISRVPRIFWNLRCSNFDYKYSKIYYYEVRLLALLSAFPEMIIVNSESGKAFHRGIGYRPRAWKTVPNGFDTDVFKPDPDAYQLIRSEYGLPRDCFLIGMVARFDPMKDHLTFLRAVQSLVDDFPHVRVLLVGLGLDAKNKKLTEILINLEIEGYVVTLGEHQDPAKIMQALDIACLSSSFAEGFPNVVGEAMSCGVPCVVTDVGASRMVVGNTGRIVPPRSPVSFADALRELLMLEESKRTEMGVRARQRIVDSFSLDAVVDQYEIIYKQAVKPGVY